MKNTPAFQFYPNDILADPDIMLWDMQTLGAYWKLVSYLWVSGGQCKLDFKLLAGLFRVRTRLVVAKMWATIEYKFIVKDGVISHDGVLKQMQVQAESRLRRQAAGIKGAQRRWGDDGNAIDLPLAKNGPSSSSSTSTPTSIASSVRESKSALALHGHDLSEVVLAWAQANGMDGESVARRTARACQVDTAWRGGCQYGSTPGRRPAGPRRKSMS